MSDFHAVIPMKAVGKGRPRMTKHGKPFTPRETRVAEDTLRSFISEANPPMYLNAVFVDLRFEMKRPPSSLRERPTVKPDLDNLIKLVTDSMNDLVYADDCQICSLTAEKVYGQVDQIFISVGEIA